MIHLVKDQSLTNKNISNKQKKYKSNYINQVLNNYHQNIFYDTANDQKQKQKQTNEPKNSDINSDSQQYNDLMGNDKNQIKTSHLQIDNQKNNENLNMLTNEDNNNIVSNRSNYHFRFSAKEDEMLLQIVEKFGAKNWNLIGKLMQGRNSKQCRDRYTNYLAPGINHSEWNEEEDKLLYEKYLKYGPKWSFLCKFFQNRTANDIKNRYNYNIIKMIPHKTKLFRKCNVILPK